MPSLTSPARAPGSMPALVTVAALAGCAAGRTPFEAPEAFDSKSTYTRTYAAREDQACEAARRALLGQGYVIGSATAEQVRGKKSFQPDPELHVEVEFNVVCARDGLAGRRTVTFVNAVQDRYALRKSNSSASVGVGVLGSLSLPFTGSNESMVKVASATITNPAFYERFFQQVESYLRGDPGQRLEPRPDAADREPPPLGAVPAAPPAASPAAPSAPTTAPTTAPVASTAPLAPGLPAR